MLDNASGSATILDIAQQLKNTNTRNKLRFIWFGGEELGLLGSDYYVNDPPARRPREDQVRPGRRRHGHAELRGGRPRPEGRGQPVRSRPRHPDAAEHLGSLGDRPRLRDRLPQLDREEPHPLLGRRHRCLHVPAGRDPGQRCPHRPGLLQARVGRQPSSAATRATSRAPCRATTGAAWTTPSAGATTSATTTPRC